jgi:GNAT superfamily N-acetyltransferase
MWFRVTQAEFSRGARDRGRKNRRAMRSLVREGKVPGLLAYLDGRPVGWVSVAPREEFGRIERSPSTRPVDDRPAWSIVCFYIDRHHRGEGVASALLEGAVEHARRQGARIVEGYPIDPKEGRVPNAEGYYGLVSMFERAGFTEAARRSRRRPVMRRHVRPRPEVR